MPYTKTVVRQSSIHGKGLFASADIEQHSYLGEYEGPVVDDNGMHVLWAEIDEGEWIGRDGRNQLRYLNHSAEPCCEFDGFELFAIRPIRAGEELTINYGYDPAGEDRE